MDGIKNPKQKEILETEKYVYFNNILLNNKWVKEIKRGVRIYIKVNENKKT